MTLLCHELVCQYPDIEWYLTMIMNDRSLIATPIILSLDITSGDQSQVRSEKDIRVNMDPGNTRCVIRCLGVDRSHAPWILSVLILLNHNDLSKIYLLWLIRVSISSDSFYPVSGTKMPGHLRLNCNMWLCPHLRLWKLVPKNPYDLVSLFYLNEKILNEDGKIMKHKEIKFTLFVIEFMKYSLSFRQYISIKTFVNIMIKSWFM